MMGTSETSLTKIPTKAVVNPSRAIWDAIWSRECDFYPLLVESVENLTTPVILTMNTEVVLSEMIGETTSWSRIKNDEELKTAIELAKHSLAEVKAQTEYQDQKATRLLTVTSFLTALSGALFTRFEESYPIVSVRGEPFLIASLIIVAYLVFLASILASLSGALVIFHATRTRFKYPPYQTNEGQEKDPRSLLFFLSLIRSRPKSWVNGWVACCHSDNADLGPIVRKDLGQRYFQNLVIETYLIAAKTADKVRYLEPAQMLLAMSLRFLFFWLVLLAVVVSLVSPAKQPQPNLSIVVSTASQAPNKQVVSIQLPKPTIVMPGTVDKGQPRGGKGQHQ